MGDLGNDAGQSAFSLGAKALSAILRLLEKLMELWKDRHRRELDKLKVQEAKTELERQKILDKLEGKKGFVDYKELKKSGLELQPLGIYMTKAEMKEFSALCKREGVLFSGMTKDTERNSDGVKTYQIVCKKTDMEKVAGIIDRMNDEKMINGRLERIAELEAKGNKMTPQDKVDVAQLKEEIAAIQKSYCLRLNDETTRNVIDKAVTGEVGRKLTLDEALNRLTGRSIDRDVVTIVADANDPSKYIKCHGYQDTYNDKPYIKTEYEVFRNAESVLKTHDGRFDGRPEGYWNKQKEAIQEAGQFSGTFFKFASVLEYQKWAEAARSQNTQELSSMAKEGEKDYSGIIKELEAQLDKNGAKMVDGKVVDKESGKPLEIAENMTSEEQTVVAEAMVIGKQINNYQEVQRLSEEIALAKAEVQIADEGTEEKTAAEANLSNLEGRYDAALKTEQQLISERKEINAVQAEQEVRNAPEQAKTQEIEYLPEDKAKIEALEEKINAKVADADRAFVNGESKTYPSVEIASMREELAQLKAQATENARNAEHPDERRGERVDEKDDRQMTMEEIKGQIAAERAKDGAKAIEVKDHQVQDQGAKAAVKTTKTHGDR